MRLRHLIEDILRLGGSIKSEVFRSGPIYQYGTFMNFGSEKAAKHAATGQNRDIYSGIISINKTAILKDSKAAHDVNPDKLAEDLVAGGTLPEPIISLVKKIKDEQSLEAAFEIIRRALESRGYDGIAYININEDPGSISYMIWDPSKFSYN